MSDLKALMEGTPILATIRLQKRYSAYWRDRSNIYWLWRLLQEFFELCGSVTGFHKDPVKWELMQIASICLNWMYKLEQK